MCTDCQKKEWDASVRQFLIFLTALVVAGLILKNT